MMRNPLRLVRDERGASIIEMALAAPLLATFLIGMVDLSRAYSMKLQVDQAAQRTIEYVQRNGFAPGQEPTLKAEAEISIDPATATVTASLECTSGSATTTKSYTSSCSTGESFARYVKVEITKTYTPLFKIRWGGNANGTYTIHGKAGVRVQ